MSYPKQSNGRDLFRFIAISSCALSVQPKGQYPENTTFSEFYLIFSINYGIMQECGPNGRHFQKKFRAFLGLWPQVSVVKID
jgi:hypothetical protein